MLAHARRRVKTELETQKKLTILTKILKRVQDDLHREIIYKLEGRKSLYIS
jgi:hypothetical protein